MAELIDANQLTEKSLRCNFCIIGAGPGGVVLANELTKAHPSKDIVVIESGGKYAEVASNQLNQVQYQSNFRHRKNFANRHRQIGGTANLWAGRALPYNFNTQLDQEWNPLNVALLNYYQKAYQFLGIEKTLYSQNPGQEFELKGLWAKKTERFNYRSNHLDGSPFRLFYHLTFIGKGNSKHSKINALYFLNGKEESFEVVADHYILAMGGIENCRCLLLLQNQIGPLLGDNFENVGKYIMDHPKITHGVFEYKGLYDNIKKYELNLYKKGKIKFGIQLTSNTNSRVYSNIVPIKPDIISKTYARTANIYKKLTKKVFYDNSDTSSSKQQSIIKDLIYLLEPEELFPHNLLRILKSFIIRRTNVYRKYNVITYLEQQPRKENRITLSLDHTDRFGVPLPVMNINIHEEELQAMREAYLDLKKRLEKIGGNLIYDELVISDSENYTEASHHLGGTRYSAIANKAVVDVNLRVLGTDNLYVLGSSVFPHGGIENPTHLIIAMACYLAQRLGKN